MQGFQAQGRVRKGAREMRPRGLKPKEKLDHRTMKEIERFLKEKRAKLKGFVRSVMIQHSTNEPSRPADSTVWATETLHNEVQIALMDRQSHQITQIEAALEQLGRQEYGICRDCEEFIGLERLRALPFAQRCAPCQTRTEREERRIVRRPVARAFAEADAA